jgi:hypothetical protein
MKKWALNQATKGLGGGAFGVKSGPMDDDIAIFQHSSANWKCKSISVTAFWFQLEVS